jgi:hypothetical protein
MRIIIVISGSALWFGWCAKNASEVQATYVSPILYENWTCQQLAEEATKIPGRAATAAGEQDRKATNDKVATTVAVIVFWRAAFLVGGDGGNAAALRTDMRYRLDRNGRTEDRESRGCAVVGKIKKERYVYHHCTGYSDKCQAIRLRAAANICAREALEAQFTELLGRLRFGDEVLEWVRDALHASHADERREHEEAIKRYQAEYNRLNHRIHAMYVDKLDGLVDTAFYDRMSNQWRKEQARCQREIERHQNADKSYLDEGVALLDLARNAQRLFASQEPREKRRLLNFVLSNCTWQDGEVVATYRQPFDLLAETAATAARAAAGETPKTAKTEIWLGD